MKNWLFSVFAFAFLALSGGSPSFAGEDPRYPGYDFKPHVIYQDKDLIHAKSGSGETQAEHAGKYDAQHPAAYFQPQVIYQDKELIQASRYDAKHPAAYFNPSVIYLDRDLVKK